MVKGERHQIGKGADEEYNGVTARDVADGRELVQQEAGTIGKIIPAALPAG